jgi:hypothetical protein
VARRFASDRDQLDGVGRVGDRSYIDLLGDWRTCRPGSVQQALSQRTPVSPIIESLLLIWAASEAEKWAGQVEFVPL